MGQQQELLILLGNWRYTEEVVQGDTHLHETLARQAYLLPPKQPAFG